LFEKHPRLKLPFFAVLSAVIYIVAHYETSGSNQNQYFLYAFKILDPGFIKNDWLTWQTFNHHFVFGYLLGYLLKVLSIDYSILLMYFIPLLFFFSAFLILNFKVDDNNYISYILSFSWIVFSLSWIDGLGWLNLLCSYTQPSLISGCFMFFGLAMLISKKHFYSGIAFGIGGLIHAGFLCAFFPLIVIMLCFDRPYNFKSIARAIFPISLALLFYVYIIHKNSSSHLDMDAYRIMTDIRAPHHFKLSQWSAAQTGLWLSWVGLALFPILSNIKHKRLKMFSVVYVFSLLICFAAIVNAYFAFSPILHNLLIWRLAPVALYISIILICFHFTSLFHNKISMTLFNKIFLIILFNVYFLWCIFYQRSFGSMGAMSKIKEYIYLLILYIPVALYYMRGDKLSKVIYLVLTVLLLSFYIYYHKEARVVIIAFWLFIPYLAKIILSKTGKNDIKLTILLYIISISLFSIDGVSSRIASYNSQVKNPGTVQLYDWIKNNTADTSLFIIPPMDFDDFRIMAQRAIIIDYKGIPFDNDNIKAWYERMCDETNYKDSKCNGVADMNNNYLYIDSGKSEYLKNKYKADYLLIENSKHKGDLSKMKIVFKNKEYTLFGLN
jgi:hypothetical protein